MAVGMSEALGSPGFVAVADWPVSSLVQSLLIVEAHDGARRYEARKGIARG